MSSRGNSRLSASQRLFKDLEEVLASPLTGVSVAPTNEDNLLEPWHGNIRCRSRGQSVHFIMEFPTTYPASPPQVFLTTPFQHDNVLAQRRGHPFKVCLDMLEVRIGNNMYRAWSAAYSVLSVLLQLQLISSKALDADEANHARRFSCDVCGHAPANSAPPFASEQDVRAAMRQTRHVLFAPIVRPLSFLEFDTTGRAVRPGQRAVAPASSAAPAAATAGLPSAAPAVTPASPTVGAIATGAVCSATTQDPAWKKDARIRAAAKRHAQETQWQQAGSGKRRAAPKRASARAATTQPGIVAAGNSFSTLANAYGAGTSAYCSSCRKSLPSSNFSHSQLRKQAKTCNKCQPRSQTNQADLPPPNVMTAAAVSKNQKRRARRSRRRAEAASGGVSPPVSSPAVSAGPIARNVPAPARAVVPIRHICSGCHRNKLPADFSNTQRKKAVSTCKECQAASKAAQPAVALDPAVAKRRARRARKRAGLRASTTSQLGDDAKNDNVTSATEELTTPAATSPAPAVPSTSSPSLGATSPSLSASVSTQSDGFTAVASSLSGRVVESDGVSLAAPAGATRAPTRSVAELNPKERRNGGQFANLPFVVLLKLLKWLRAKEVPAWGQVCRFNHAAMQDGRLWRVLFATEYPLAQVSAAALSDWRHVFHVQVNRTAQTLICYHSKQTYLEDVLGWPIEYTTNPRTKRIDYIFSSMDLLSHRSFKRDKVRTTVWNQAFQEWLPLCLTDEHFTRALPLLKKSIVKLCPHIKTTRFSPTMVLEVLPKLMNTMIVLICDKGVHASDQALEGFCMLHRLFIALMEKFPRLQTVVRNRLLAFARTDAARVKEKEPSLGDLLPLLSVCDSVTWRQLAVPYLTECFDRAVIWICKEYPGLASVDRTKLVDEERIERSFTSTLVSLRLSMFHAYFLQNVVHPHGASLAQVAERYDHLYGRPTMAQKQHFRNAVYDIMAVRDYYKAFTMCGLRAPTPEALTKLLRDSVGNSLRKRYHNNRTDFCRIQSSGISAIFSRLKREGAKDGRVVVSLIWNNHDDLDLHVTCPGGHRIFFGARTCPGCLGELDVDMNAGEPCSDEPVENVVWATLYAGKYEVSVVNFANRTGAVEVPFEVHVKVDGESHFFQKTWKQTHGSSGVPVYNFTVKKGLKHPVSQTRPV